MAKKKMKITDALVNTGAGVAGGVAAALVKKLPVNEKIAGGIALAASAALPLLAPSSITYAIGAGMAGSAGKDLVASLTGGSFISGEDYGDDPYLPYYDSSDDSGEEAISGEDIAVANDNALSGIGDIAVANDNAISGISPDSVGMI